MTTQAMDIVLPKVANHSITIESLPEEIFGDVFSFLPFTFAVRCLTRVNQKFYHLVYKQVHKAIFVRKDIKKDCTFNDLVYPLQKFKNLSYLSITEFDDKISDSCMKQILSNCKSLKTLEITCCNELESINISDCVSLTKLNLNNCETLRTIEVNQDCCKNLTEIDFSSTLVSDQTIKTILSYSTPRLLKNIALSDCLEIREFPPFQQILKVMLATSKFQSNPSQPDQQNQNQMDMDWTPNNSNKSYSKSPKNHHHHHHSSAHKAPTASQTFKLESLDISYCFRIKLKSTSDATNTLTVPLTTTINNHHNSLEDANSNHSSIPPIVVHDLRLRRTLLSDDQLYELMKLIQINKLRQLNVYGCLYLKQPKIASKSLQVLDLSHTHIEDDTLKFIVMNCPSLSNLKLFNCRELHSPSIVSDSVQIIDLGYCSGLESPQIICNNLQDFSVRNTEVNDATLESILMHSSQQLKTLTLSQCNNLEKPKIRAPLLETLNANSCEELTTPYFENCDSLKNLILFESKITDDDLDNILRNSNLPSLKVLDLRWCSNIKNTFVMPNTTIKILK